MPGMQPTRRARVLLVATLLAGFAGQAWAARKPNIVMLAIDDLNDWVGAYEGFPQSHTPNLDRLAARGVSFQNAQTPMPLCDPARAAIFSGIAPASSGYYLNSEEPGYFRSSNERLRWATTLPQFLKERGGYVIKTSGKLWHKSYVDLPKAKPDLNPNDRNDSGRGYTEFDEVFNNGASFDDPQRARIGEPGFNPNRGRPITSEEGTIRSVDISVVVPGTDLNAIQLVPVDAAGRVDRSGDARVYEQMADTKIARWAANAIRSHDSATAPLYLQAGFTKPHLPWTLPMAFFEKFPLAQTLLPEILETDSDDLPPPARRLADPEKHNAVLAAGGGVAWQRLVRGYLAAGNYVDSNVGIVLEALQERARQHPQEDWVLVVWSDHGFHLGEKTRWGKWSLWEESARVPLLIWRTRKYGGGRTVDVPVNLLDLFPTLSEIAGLKAPPQVQGHSLLDLLRSKARSDDAYSVTSRSPEQHSVRSKHWRYTRYEDGSEELYDHRRDPNEWNNLLSGASASAHDEVRRRLSTALYRWSVKVRDLTYFGADGVPAKLASIPTSGSRAIELFDGPNGNLNRLASWTTRVYGFSGGQDFIVRQGKARVEAPNGIVLSTIDSVVQSPKDNFLLSALVNLKSGDGSAGLVFGYENREKYFAAQLASDATGGIRVQVIRRQKNSVDRVVANSRKIVSSKGESHLLVVDYDRGASSLELIAFNSAGIAIFRRSVAIGAIDGGGFGIRAKDAPGTSMDFMTALVGPGKNPGAR